MKQPPRETPEAIDLRTSRELASLLASGRNAEAEQLLATLIESQPAPNSREVVARDLLVQGEAERALGWLPAEVTDDYAGLRLLRARALLAQGGQLEQAVATLSARVPAVADQPEYRITLATLLQQVGQTEPLPATGRNSLPTTTVAQPGGSAWPLPWKPEARPQRCAGLCPGCSLAGIVSGAGGLRPRTLECIAGRIMTTEPKKKIRIGDLLVQNDVITEQQLMTALREQKNTGRKLGRTLIDLGYVDEDNLLNILSRQLEVPFVQLRHYQSTTNW